MLAIDLDSIELSNLNRQFLFRREHIGQSKAEVAAAAAARFNPRAKIVGLHANIKEARFGVAFFRQFGLVMNALDNIDARRHVNRLCLAAQVPLVESGTAGFLGQATVILAGRTECYECRPKSAPKSFAVCTIRSTPSKPVHCVVWAKEIFGELFGPPLAADAADGKPAADDEDEFAGAPDACLADALIAGDAARLERERVEHGAARHLFYKQFHYDIFRRLRVADIAGKQPWKDRTLPRPLTFEAALAMTAAGGGGGDAQLRADQRVPSVAACAEQFVAVATRLLARERRVTFDKDDDDAMAFVSAAANLRSYVFDIPLQSEFQVKSIAGNIVPAIATTNAVIAGFIVIEALKILNGRLDECKTTYLMRQPSSGRKLLAAQPDTPNSACFVCQKATQTLTIDTEHTTLAALLHVLRAELSFVEPGLMLGDTVKYESGDGLDSDERGVYAANLERTLAQLGIVHDSIVTVDDFAQEMNVQLIVNHAARASLQADAGAEHTVLYRLDGQRPKVAAAHADSADAAADDDDDDEPIEIVNAPPPPPPPTAVAASSSSSAAVKRTADQVEVIDDSDDEHETKRSRI